MHMQNEKNNDFEKDNISENRVFIIVLKSSFCVISFDFSISFSKPFCVFSAFVLILKINSCKKKTVMPLADKFFCIVEKLLYYGYCVAYKGAFCT